MVLVFQCLHIAFQPDNHHLLVLFLHLEYFFYELRLALLFGLQVEHKSPLSTDSQPIGDIFLHDVFNLLKQLPNRLIRDLNGIGQLIVLIRGDVLFICFFGIALYYDLVA